MLSTAATSITVSEKRTGATKRIANREISVESFGLRCSRRFIPGPSGVAVTRQPIGQRIHAASRIPREGSRLARGDCTASRATLDYT